jgi:hypothetical protein
VSNQPPRHLRDLDQAFARHAATRRPSVIMQPRKTLSFPYPVGDSMVRRKFLQRLGGVGCADS